MNNKIYLKERLASLLMIAALSAPVLSCGALPGKGGLSVEKERRCGEIAGKFEKVLANRKDTCVTHSDCGCYNPVSKSAGCGGVTDRATAAALGELEKEFHKAGCRWPIQCAAWICSPACVKGRCFNGN